MKDVKKSWECTKCGEITERYLKPDVCLSCKEEHPETWISSFVLAGEDGKMELEFKAEDIVHFQAYTEREPITARVLSAEIRERFPSGDLEPEYKLEGVGAPLVSHTSGRSIVESKYHYPISEKDAFK